MIRAIIFDLDGTLVDTEPAAARAVAACFRDWGVPLDPKDSAFLTGRTWESAFSYLLPKYGPLPVPNAEATEIILEAYRRSLRTELVFVPGAVECVRALATEFPLALVSGSHRREIAFALDRLGVTDAFRFYLGAEDYPRSKPAPDGYLASFPRLGVRPQETLIFEDSTAGIASGIDAGAWVTAVTCANHLRQRNESAHWCIEDLRGVDPAWVRALRPPAPGAANS